MSDDNDDILVCSEFGSDGGGCKTLAAVYLIWLFTIVSVYFRDDVGDVTACLACTNCQVHVSSDVIARVRMVQSTTGRFSYSCVLSLFHLRYNICWFFNLPRHEIGTAGK